MAIDLMQAGGTRQRNSPVSKTKGKKIFVEKSSRAAEEAEAEAESVIVPVPPPPPPVKEANNTLNAILYALFNISSASAIVFANKAIFSVYQFDFPFTLTFVHTLVTVAGMWAFSAGSLFKVKKLPMMEVAPLALAFVGYIVLGNINLKVNTVSFYQISKIAVAPAVLAIDFIFYRRVPSVPIAASVAVVCVGIGFATMSELEGASGIQGALIGFGAVLSTAMYQVWVGAKQKELGVGSMQLLHQSTPQSSLMLLGAVLVMEQPLMTTTGGPLGFDYTFAAVATIIVSALLGLAVSLSTFLVIGATSSLTYNVVGHIKTTIIIGGGLVLFDDTLPPAKILGLILSMAGIITYSILKIREGTLVNNGPKPRTT